MKVFNAISKKFAGKLVCKTATKGVAKKMLLGSFTNIFTSILIWIIEFFLHPFMQKWRNDILKKLGWTHKKANEETAIAKKEA